MERCNNRDEIKCPHCGYLNAMDAEQMPWTDDREYDERCHSCSEQFILKADVSVSWTTHKDEDDE